jgi:hypothetical protein
MVIKKILNMLKKNPEKSAGKSKVSVSNRIKSKSSRDPKPNDQKDDWANRSGVYSKLSDGQKKYLDKLNKIIDKELDDWNKFCF